MKSTLKKLLSGCFCAAALSSSIVSFVSAQTSQEVSTASDANIARGAYLVEGLGHCGACHTPRGIGFQEQGYTAQDPLFLSGAVVENWRANDLRALPLTQDEIAELLKYGITQKKGVFGPMREVITESTQFLSDEDLHSIAAYLLSLKSSSTQQSSQNAPVGEPSASKDAAALGVYMTYCSTCHGASGTGVAHTIPALAGNSNVIAKDARNLIHILHNGARTPTLEERQPYVMPAYKEILTEEQMIALINYLRQSWGNQAAPITPKEYQEVTK